MPFVRAGDLETFHLDAGSGTPLVLIHGNWGSSTWWEPVLERLPNGRRAVAPDLRGRGQSRGPDTDYGIASMANDVLAFADALDLGKFDLVGHSLGSCVAMEIALAHPERLRSLVVVSPGWIDGMPGAYAIPERQKQLKDDPAFLAMALRAIAPAVTGKAFKDREGAALLLGTQHVLDLIAGITEMRARHAIAGPTNRGGELAIEDPHFVLQERTEIASAHNATAEQLCKGHILCAGCGWLDLRGKDWGCPSE